MDIETRRVQSRTSGILVRARGSRTLIQDYCPLAERVEWQLGQYLYQEVDHRSYGTRTKPGIVKQIRGLARKAYPLQSSQVWSVASIV